MRDSFFYCESSFSGCTTRMLNVVEGSLSRYSRAVKAGEERGRKLPVKARLVRAFHQ